MSEIQEMPAGKMILLAGAPGSGKPSCFFTTGFLNGLFSAVKNQHVREMKCVVAGDPYCEWEFA